MATVAQVRAIALSLPRTEEHLIRDRVKFRVGRIVYAALSRDETQLGFAYPRDERDELIASAPELFFPPIASELRFHWVESHLDRLSPAELTELITDAWRMVVPKSVARQHLGA